MAAPLHPHTTNGLHRKRTLVCPCGAEFTTTNPGARYCCDACRKRLGRYGRSYGRHAPRKEDTA